MAKEGAQLEAKDRWKRSQFSIFTSGRSGILGRWSADTIYSAIPIAPKSIAPKTTVAELLTIIIKRNPMTAPAMAPRYARRGMHACGILCKVQKAPAIIPMPEPNRFAPGKAQL